VTTPKIALLALTLTVASWSVAGAQMKMPPGPLPGPPAPFQIVLSPTTLAGLPRQTLSATDEGGHTNSYSGVSLEDLLVRAGVPHGGPMRGKAMMSYVLITAADGYHVLFTLPELDASYGTHVVLIADTRDGVPFLPDAGPYRLITPFDKRDGRWVKQVTAVALQNVTPP
jgi:hypothetical protein